MSARVRLRNFLSAGDLLQAPKFITSRSPIASCLCGIPNNHEKTYFSNRGKIRFENVDAEYNNFTWECNQLAAFSSSEHEKLNFVVFQRT